MPKKAQKEEVINQPRSFIVVVDTKEKQPWSFSSPSILGVEYRHLKTGDYSVVDLEDVLCIERKKNASELAQNIHQTRFHAELERMQSIKYRYLLLESSIQKVIDYPRLEDLPQSVLSKIRVSGAYLLRCLNRIQVKYGINIIYCGNAYNAAWVATNLMREVVDIHYGQS